jgi:hypothetical protein
MMFLLPGRRLASCKALYPRTRRPLKMGAQSSWARGYYVEADAMRKITLALLLSTATCFPARADSSDSMRQGLFCSGLAAEIYAINSTEAAEKIADAGFEKCLCLWRKDARSTLTELKGQSKPRPFGSRDGGSDSERSCLAVNFNRIRHQNPQLAHLIL